MKMITPSDSLKTNPIQTQYKANTNPIPERPKMNENLFATKVYENITTFRLEQNKPNTNPIKPNLSRRSLWRSRIKQFSRVGPEVRFILIWSIDTNQKSAFGYFNFKNFFFVRIQHIPCTLVLWRIEQFIEQ